MAYLVHLFTASGAWASIVACQRIVQGDYRSAFLFMFLAVLIDSVDGSMARALDVEKNCPDIDGRRLDDMVDYFGWVVVPVFLMAHSGVLPAHSSYWALPLMASALGMAHRHAKTEDDFFRGFPSLWNVVALYLWMGGLSSSANAVIVTALSVAVLAPVKFIYPSKTRYLKNFSSAFMLVWLVFCVASLWLEGALARTFFGLSLLFPAYYIGLSLLLNVWSPKSVQQPNSNESKNR